MDWATLAAWSGLLAGLRAGTTDFALRPERWETQAPIPIVENVLRAPLSGPGAVDDLEKRIRTARASAGLIAAGFESLGVKPSAATPAKAPTPIADLPPELSAAVGTLIERLKAAHEDLAIAIAPFSAADRARATTAVDASIGDDAFLQTRGDNYKTALRFDMPRLAAAGIAAANAVDDALPALQAARAEMPADFSKRWNAPFGTVLLSKGDDEFGPEDLAAAGLIIRFGGRTKYKGPAAAAAAGQVRVIIDLGGPAVIDSTGPAAGSADFGIGLLYLVGPGHHEIKTGGMSLGAARFGVAFADVEGDSNTLTSRRFSQAAASFGVAVLETNGAGLKVSAPLAAQAYATTRGAAVWRHHGDAADASCGFEMADPRESLGFVSQGQGAGMGPRAYAAGGVGAAHLTGNDINLRASYFAQGSGYWHGLGALFVRGDRSRLQARRYSLGTGVHAAVGALDVKGHDTRIESWGVGPGFGWDYGVGLFRLRGDRARLRADWADGRADLGGRSLSWIEGDDNQLSLAEFGSGSYTRAQAGYGLALVKGSRNRLRAAGLPAPIGGAFERNVNAWGVLRAEGELTLDPALALPDPIWPTHDPAAMAARAAEERPKAAALLAPPPASNRRAHVSQMLFAASAHILDANPAQTAARALTGLSASDAPALAQALDADRFDELMWARLAAAGLGPAAAKAVAVEAKKAKGARRVALLDWLRFGSVEDSLPVAERLLTDSDWRVRRQGVSVISSLFADDGGSEPGRRRLLRAGVDASSDTVGQKRLSDLYAALALSGPATESERLTLLAAARSPFDVASPDAVNAYARMAASSPARVAALRREEADCARLLSRARAALKSVLADSDDEVASAALSGLGGTGATEDAPLLSAALDAQDALRREAAAAGLSRMGPGARAEIARALASPSARTRALAAVAASQNWDEPTFLLIRKAFSDREASVRAAAVAALSSTPGTLTTAKAGLLEELRKLASDPDISVRMTAAVAVASIAPAK
jgi:hypothetical protein